MHLCAIFVAVLAALLSQGVTQPLERKTEKRGVLGLGLGYPGYPSPGYPAYPAFAAYHGYPYGGPLPAHGPIPAPAHLGATYPGPLFAPLGPPPLAAVSKVSYSTAHYPSPAIDKIGPFGVPYAAPHVAKLGLPYPGGFGLGYPAVGVGVGQLGPFGPSPFAHPYPFGVLH